MGVTTDGVKGYEYQYKVTLLIFLSSEPEKIKLTVEIEGSEDATIEISDKGINTIVEIQVKREKDLIQIPKLVNWLCHFQERSSQNNLFQRLIDNKSNFVLFVTHSRCSDDVYRFREKFPQFGKHDPLSYSNTWIKTFADALKNQNFPKTILGKNRESFCKNQSKSVKRKLISEALERCIIFEELTDEKVDKIIIDLLNSKYRVANSQTNKLYLDLLETVREGRDSGLDISKSLLLKIETSKIGYPKIDKRYKQRQVEEKLIQVLINKGCLLLTGSSQCGKSEVAKTIASYFVNKGYDYHINEDINATNRFLSSNITDSKILILEDPFGHIVLKENQQEILRKLKQIVENSESHHLLIVTSRIEILHELFNSPNIKDYKIKDHQWIDLTIKNKDEIILYWNYLATINNLPKPILSEVSNGLKKSRSEDLLQIGQLSYLAHEEIDSIIGKRFVDLEHVARRDSKEMAINLNSSNRAAGELLSILSICSTSTQSIEFNDLAFIKDENSDLMSIIEKDGFTSVFGRDNNPLFPEYPNDINLTESIEDTLSYLDSRGFVLIVEKTILIRHPNYYEAGRYLFYKNGSISLMKRLFELKKGIACLNPKTALISSKSLSFLYPKLNKDQKKEIISIAFMGLKSIFPAVEDNSLIFLINEINNIEDSYLTSINSIIQKGGTSSTNIYWHNNIPFISDGGSFSNIFIKVDKHIIERAESNLKNGILPEKHDAWIFIEELKGNQTVTKEYLYLLLQYDEAFIRKKVVSLVFFKSYALDEDIIQSVFNDEHPSVVFAAIRFALINWFNLSANFQPLIIDLIKKSLKQRQIAIRTYNLIATFSIHYGDEALYNWEELSKLEKEVLWNLWGELFPICMGNIPLGLNINSARFGETMRSSMEYLDLTIGIEVLTSWYERIDYQLKNGEFLDEFEMAIADDLMGLTGVNHEARKDIFSKIVSYEDTGFLISSLKWITNYWDILNLVEKTKILDLVKSDRIDVRWIKSVLLNSHAPPKELVLEILEEENLFEKGAEYFIAQIPNQLLEDCLNVYCGSPQPLWWLAVHHRNTEFWNSVIKEILLREKKIGYEICLEEFVSDGVNGFSLFRDGGMEFWKNLCETYQDKTKLTESLISNMARSSSSLYSTSEMWDILIKAYGENNDDLKLTISTHFHLIYSEFLEDFVRVLDPDFVEDILKPIIMSIKITEQEALESGRKKKQETIEKFEYKLDNWIGKL